MRTQTVVYNFPVLDWLENNTLTNTGTIAANFMKVDNVSIQNAFIVVKMDDVITATGGSITTKRIDLSVNNSLPMTFSNSSSYISTGENIFWVIPFDVTSNVATNFNSNDLNTFSLSILVNQSSGTPKGFVNVCADLYITYAFDEVHSTRIVKTAFIPIGSSDTALETTSIIYGQIPALETYLPEYNKSYDNIAIVCEVNRSDSITDTSITMEIPDLILGVNSMASVGALTAGRMLIYNWKLNEQTYDIYNFHRFYANASTNDVMYSPVFYLIVTYSYSLKETSTVLNSLLLGNIGGATGNATTLFERVETELLIPESNITAQRIMALFYFSAEDSDSQIRLRIDKSGEFSNPYSVVQSLSTSERVCGIYSDSLILTEGENILTLDYYTTDTYAPKGMYVLWMVNYISDTTSGGIDNNRTIITLPMLNLSRPRQFTATTKICPLSELDYYITNGFFVFATDIGFSLPISSLSAEILTSEGGDSGELIFIAATLPFYSDYEMGWKFTFYPFDFNKIKRFPGDITSNKMIEVTSTRQLMVVGIYFLALFSYTTIHSITKTISGVVRDSSNNPVDSADVLLIRFSSKPKIMKSTTSNSEGSYLFTVYDNLSKYIVYSNKSGTPNIFDATDSNLQGS